MKGLTDCTLMICVVGLFVGCGQSGVNPSDASPERVPTSAPTVDGSQFLLASEPEGVMDVIQAREAARDKDNVVIVGRIGGRAKPWIEGRAAFSIVDRSLKACSDIPGNTCKMPWDYCCEPNTNLRNSSATIKLVDQEGKLVPTDARELLQVKELQTVVIRGKASRDDVGNLTVLADGVFLRNER